MRTQKHVAEWLSSESTFGWPLGQVTGEACVKLKADNDSNSLDVAEEAESTSPLSRPGWPLLRISATSKTTSTTTPAREFGANKSVHFPNRSTLENLQLADEGCRIFSYAEIRTATSEFSSENLIGEGGCSSVYRGCLRGGKSVAVKILKSYKEAWDDFCLEAKFVSSVKHKNIASLVGVCVEDDNLVLLYELFPRGSLEDNLHRCDDGSVLPWEVRFNVAVAVAEALDFLHDECPQPIIHRDVKTSNILLCNELHPQLSDFGLAIWGTMDSSYVICKDVVGTFGYLAPEYFMQGRVSDKVDVYAFGVVMLELLSGRKPVDFEAPKGQESLVKWARKLLNMGDLNALMDPKLKGIYNIAQMRRMSLAASLCTNQSAQLRPCMSQVLKVLRGKTSANGLDHDEDEDDQFLEVESSTSRTVSERSNTCTKDDTASSSSSSDTASSEGKTPRLKLKDLLTIPDYF